MDAHSEPPVPHNAYPVPSPALLPVLYEPHTRRQAAIPPLMVQLIEIVSMAPSVTIDESHVKVAGNREQSIALECMRAALIYIRDDKSKTTMREIFAAVLGRPLVADMYLAGNAFESDIQTDYVHIWRKSESLAVIHGTESPEQMYSDMLLETFMDARDTTARITEKAGGPVTSIAKDARPRRHTRT